jgi:hypothetical protein
MRLTRFVPFGGSAAGIQIANPQARSFASPACAGFALSVGAAEDNSYRISSVFVFWRIRGVSLLLKMPVYVKACDTVMIWSKCIDFTQFGYVLQ